ncbi:MAG: polysaccharide biosynthesis protein [Bacteroidota bacterium]
MAYLLRFNFAIPETYLSTLKFVIPFVLVLRAITFFLGKTYAGIVRYTGLKDAERILLVVTCGSLILILSNYVNYLSANKTILIPFSVIIIDLITTVYLMTSLRLAVKFLYVEFSHSGGEKKNIVIFGTRELAVLTKRALDFDTENRYRIVAFIDSFNPKNKKLEGISIIHYYKLESIIEKQNIQTLIFAKSYVTPAIKNQIVDLCLSRNIEVKTVPAIKSWIDGQLSARQLKKIRIEDLLERSPIILDTTKIKKQLENKVVLVTGAAGSIGSEIVRQVSRFPIRKLIMLDQAESPLYSLELEIIQQCAREQIAVEIGDITNRARMENIFRLYKPDIIYHAAAYKHVPMMENMPTEAVRNNVFGTKLIADLAVKHKSGRFVMVSTDKAVNPTNVMGATKRLAEIYTQSLHGRSSTAFITTRFGNVLGSNGSVIPLFRQQIENGGPVTVTHPEITRFFMTIPEACQLVLEAGALGTGGEIFVFDMGKSVKVLDLAKNMIRLSGFEPNKDIKIVYTGLRPGEKLYEEVLHNNENTIPTHHPKIKIAEVRKYNYKHVSEKINNLVFPEKAQDNFAVVRILKDIIPEYISKNSIYEQLDSTFVASTTP